MISTIKTQPPMIADELRRQADFYVELADLTEHIARAHTPRPAVSEEPDEPDEEEYDDEYDDDDEDDDVEYIED